jgi:hypothetical protein
VLAVEALLVEVFFEAGFGATTELDFLSLDFAFALGLDLEV